MKTIAVHLQKGGIGKTSLTGSIGYELSLKGKTLMIDADAQGNLSSWMLKDKPVHDLAQVLNGHTQPVQAIKTLTHTLDLLPTMSTGGTLRKYSETSIHKEPEIFKELLKDLESQEYEYIIFDLSPAIGTFEKTILSSVDEVITPIIPEYFCLDGLEIFATEMIELKKLYTNAPNHTKVVINSFDSRIIQHNDVLYEINKLNLKTYQIPVDPAFRKAQALHLPIQQLPKASSAKKKTTTSLTRIAKDI